MILMNDISRFFKKVNVFMKYVYHGYIYSNVYHLISNDLILSATESDYFIPLVYAYVKAALLQSTP